MTTKAGTSISRRQFLGGSAASMGALALGWSPPRYQGPDRRRGARVPDGVTSLGDGAATALHVGYWSASARMADLHAFRIATSTSGIAATAPSRPGAAEDPRVIAAERLPAGDPALVRAGARVTFHGLFEADRSLFRAGLDRLTARLHFAAPGTRGGKTIPFSAWHYDRRPVPNVSAGLGATVPVNPGIGLLVSVERRNGRGGPLAAALDALARGHGRPGEAAAATPGVARFVPGREAGAAKLCRGVYFIAAPAGGARERPAWRGLEFLPAAPGGAMLLARRGSFGLEPAEFDYLVVSIEAAVREA